LQARNELATVRGNSQIVEASLDSLQLDYKALQKQLEVAEEQIERLKRQIERLKKTVMNTQENYHEASGRSEETSDRLFNINWALGPYMDGHEDQLAAVKELVRLHEEAKERMTLLEQQISEAVFYSDVPAVSPSELSNQAQALAEERDYVDAAVENSKTLINDLKTERQDMLNSILGFKHEEDETYDEM